MDACQIAYAAIVGELGASQIQVHWLWQGKSWSVADSQDNSSTCGYCYSVELIHKQLLGITFSLLSAIIVACSHVTSWAHAKAHMQYMCDYIKGIKKLFPQLETPSKILQYGPIHSWWTFPFERLIGIIQWIPNNGKQGNQGVFAMYTAHNGWQANLKWQLPNHMFALQIFEAY